MKSFKQFLLIENKEEMINQLRSLFKKEDLSSEILSSYLPLVEEIYARFKGSNLYQFLSTVLKDLILTENGKKAKVKSITKQEFKNLLMELEHFYAYDFIKKHYKLVAKKPYDQVLRELKEQENEWKKSNPHLIPPDGKKILTFPDGYFWVDLEKHHCKMEQQAMGHCGTTSKDETLLSLRKEVKKGNKTYHEPHVTFSLRPDGYLTEMKGKENTKPSEKYHKYIIELLNHSRIKGIFGGGYQPEANFNILDLHPDQWKKIYSKNKNMLGDFSKEYHEVAQKLLKRDLTKEEQLEYVKKDPYFIQLFFDADKDVQIAALVENREYSIINFMKNPIPQVIDFALNNYKWHLPNKKIFNRMNDQQKMKLEQNQINAVENYWRTIEDIFDNGIKPSEKVIFAAIDNGWYRPPKKIYDKLSSELKKKIEKNQIEAVKNDWRAIQYIMETGYDPSEAVQIAAVKQDWRTIDYIIESGFELSDNVIAAAIYKGWYLPPKEIYDKLSPKQKKIVENNQIAAVKYKPWLILRIIYTGYEPSDNVIAAAINSGWYDPPKEIYDKLSSEQKNKIEKNQIAKVKKNSEEIYYIKYVYDSVIKYVIDNCEESEIADMLENDYESQETKQKLQAAFDKKYR